MDKCQVVPFPKGAASTEADPQSPIVQKLKAERVQEPAATLRTELKAERVQEELAAAGGEGEAKVGLVLELAIHQPQTVTVELFAAKVTITFHGNAAVANG